MVRTSLLRMFFLGIISQHMSNQSRQNTGRLFMGETRGNASYYISSSLPSLLIVYNPDIWVEISELRWNSEKASSEWKRILTWEDTSLLSAWAGPELGRGDSRQTNLQTLHRKWLGSGQYELNKMFGDTGGAVCLCRVANLCNWDSMIATPTLRSLGSNAEPSTSTVPA